MKPIRFKECNVEYAKGQEEYTTLPGFADTANGCAITCYKMSFRDLLKVIFTRKIYLNLLTFNGPLTPQQLTVNKKEVINPKFANELNEIKETFTY